MHKTGFILSLGLLIASTAIESAAQTGNCEPALGEAMLEGGNVRARIFNNGGFFWRGSPAVYEAPIGSGANAIFTAGIWIGGLIDNQVRTAASRYGKWEFWAGPLDEQGNPPDNCSDFDKIWEVNYRDLLNLRERGEISGNLVE